MHIARKSLVLIAALATVTASCDDDDDDGTQPTLQEFTATLTGGAERPTAVVTNATGSAVLSFTGTGPISYSVTVSNLSSAPTGAHIHGPADVNTAAGIIVGLTPIATTQSGTLVSGTISATGVATISLDSLKKLLGNGNAYINVHTGNFPNGEIRGQIVNN